MKFVSGMERERERIVVSQFVFGELAKKILSRVSLLSIVALALLTD